MSFVCAVCIVCVVCRVCACVCVRMCECAWIPQWFLSSLISSMASIFTSMRSESESGASFLTRTEDRGGRGDGAAEAEREGEGFGFLALAEGGDVVRAAADAVRLRPERLREGS